MRRRLFWTIVAVATVTGLLVLAGSVLASRRLSRQATYRELANSANEAVLIVDDALDRAGGRPAAVIEVLRLLEGEQVGQLFARIRRTAGSSEIGIGAATADGEVISNSSLFARVQPDLGELRSGSNQFTSSDTGELVVISASNSEIGSTDVRLLVAVARDAPIVRLADQFGAIVLLVVGIGLVAAVSARVLSARLANELEPLAEASRRLASGDLSARVEPLDDPDLDSVAEAFNDMASDLEETNEREREFILGIGHDLRTPLTTIGGYAEALEAGDIDLEELSRIGGVLGVQSRQLGRLVEDLSTLARLAQPEFTLRLEEVDVGAHVTEVVKGFERRATELGISLGCSAEKGLLIETDPDRLGQIASNLVENALRHTPETGSIDVTISGAESGVRLEVRDSGSGIGPEDLAHVFDRHFVGRERSVHKEGTGLGLSIVKGLVELMGGQVTATSDIGRGTRITVSLVPEVGLEPRSVSINPPIGGTN